MKVEIQEYSPTAAALATLSQKYGKVVYDVTTTAGMKSAIEGRAELRTYRVDLEKKRKEIKAPALERCRLIDEEAKRITAELVAMETPIDDQIKAEEARKEAEKAAKVEAERRRVAAIQLMIDSFRQAIANAPSASADIEKYGKLIADTPIGDAYQELKPEALAAKEKALDGLTALFNAAVERETEQERVRKEQAAEAARIAAERAELAKLRAESEAREAELKKLRDAEESRLKAERAEEARKQALIQAEEEAKNIAARAALEAERQAAAEVARKQSEEQHKLDMERLEIERQKIIAQNAEEARKARAKKLAKAKRDTPTAALADILAICQDLNYSDEEARNDISLIAEASLP